LPRQRGRENPALAFFRLAEPLPLLVRPVVPGLDPPDGARTAAGDERFGLGPVRVVLDALQQLAIRDAGRGEKDVVAANQVVDAEHPVEVGARGLRFARATSWRLTTTGSSMFSEPTASAPVAILCI